MASTIATGLRVRVNRLALLQALKKLTPVTKGASIPILKGVKLCADENGTFTALTTNMEIALRLVVPAEVGGAGAIVVPIKQLTMVAQYTPAEDLELRQEGTGEATLRVAAGADEFTIRGFSPDDFPSIPQSLEPYFDISRSDLLELAGTVLATRGWDDSKPWLTAAYLRVNDTIQAVATDGVCIGGWDKPATIHRSGNCIVIPGALQLAGKMAAPGETVHVTRDEIRVGFIGNGFEVYGRTFEGQYPEVWTLVPDQYIGTVTVDRLDLVSACNLAIQWGAQFQIALQSLDGFLEASMQHPEIGSFRRRLPATVSTTMEPTGFNAYLLAPMLKQLGGLEAVIHFVGPRKPVMITSPDRPHLKFCILPLIKWGGDTWADTVAPGEVADKC